MSRRLLLGPLLLLAWQTAPISAVPDSGGRYRIELGFGGGTLETRRVDCGGITSARPQSFTTGSIAFEAWPLSSLRVEGAGTVFASDPRGTGGTTAWLPAAVVAYEAGSVGVGAGVAYVGALKQHISGDYSGPPTLPAFYLRLGSRNRFQYRLDVLTPNVFATVTGLARTGVAWGQGPEHRLSGFAGLSVAAQSDLSHPVGVFGEFGIPIAGRFDALIAGGWRPAQTTTDWSAAVGGRVSLGR